ncbi:hypothetical protein LEMLEM_LOCUS6115 [Lemmus lemmus]
MAAAELCEQRRTAGAAAFFPECPGGRQCRYQLHLHRQYKLLLLLNIFCHLFQYRDPLDVQ